MWWGRSLGRVSVAMLEGADRADIFWAGGLVEKSHWFGCSSWLGGGGLITGVMQEDLPISVRRVEAHAVALSGLWLLRLILLHLWLVGTLISAPVRVVLLRGQVCRCLRLGLGLGVECAAYACHLVAREVIAHRACVSPLERCFRDVFRHVWLSLSLSLVLSESVPLCDHPPPLFGPTGRSVKWVGPCLVVVVGSSSPSGSP